MKLDRRQALAALSAATLSPQTWAQTARAPRDLPVEAFFRSPQMSQASMNPAADLVALCVEGETGRTKLAVVDLRTMAAKNVASFEEEDVGYFQWLNDERMLFMIADAPSRGRSWSWAAVDADGADLKQFGVRGWPLAQGPQTSAQALFARVQDISEGPGFLALSRFDTRKAREQELAVPPWSVGFLIDGRDEPVAALTVRADRLRWHWRDGDAWRVVREGERFAGEAFSLAGVGPDGTVYVNTRKGHDQSALYTYDPKTNSLSDKPVLMLTQFDLMPELVFGRGKLLGVHVLADARTTVWLDDECRALQAKVDARLPHTTNLLSLPRRGDSPWVLIRAYSDRQPVLAMVYHRDTEKLTTLGRSMPQIDPALMSRMDYTPYRARDGRSIPAYLTLPRSAGDQRPLPLVVLVHGGPFVRGASWEWDDEVQFLASRGYAVLQPEFRGSIGFGEDHFKAGWRQWGQAMQDDLADGAKWVMAQGIAAPRRIAIAGASYGGYAAMMGLARHSDIFACAVNWVGVTDLDLIYGAYWSDQTSVLKRYGLPKVLGDRDADAAMLKDNSPIHLADRIRKPVLMAYGQRDLRVPIEHGERMRDALARHNPNVEWVRYEDEGHGWHELKTRVDFWSRVERFLDKHLKA